MIRNTCFASQLFWDKVNQDRILVERHRYENDPEQEYVFYKTKFATIRSKSAAASPRVSAKIHQMIGSLFPDVEKLAENLDDWLEQTKK